MKTAMRQLQLTHGAGLSPGVEAFEEDYGFSQVGGDHPGAFGRGASVLAQVGFDIN